MDLKGTKTEKNLMEAFAGESQARNRYTFAADVALQQKQHMIADVLYFTANQEKEHALVFYNHLKELAGETIEIDGGYPIDISQDLTTLLQYAQHNEYEEADDVYIHFANTAENEGFNKVAQDFRNIAKIEKIHGDRFGNLAQLLQNNQLYTSSSTLRWMCQNCGFIFEGTQVPEKCPVCDHDQGFFIRLSCAPYTCEKQ